MICNHSSKCKNFMLLKQEPMTDQFIAMYKEEVEDEDENWEVINKEEIYKEVNYKINYIFEKKICLKE